MPNAATAASAGTTALASNEHATELSAPVVEDQPIDAPLDANLFGAESDETTQDDTATTAADDAAPAADDVPVPARLKGKSLPQIIQEFSGLEKEYGRQGNELGEARALLREALKAAIEQTPGAKPGAVDNEPDPSDEDFDVNPKGAAEKLIAKKLKPITAALTKAEQDAAMLRFEAKRPGYQEEASTPEFQAWVKASPYRMRMFQDAAAFDMDAATDLFAAWDAAKPTAEAPPSKKETLKKVTTETGGAGKPAGGKSGKKLYKAADLMRLFVQDRDRYNEMADEIRAAYAEGRVR